MLSLPKWRLLLVKKTSAGPNHEKYTDLLLNTYYYNSATLYLNTYHFYFNFFFLVTLLCYINSVIYDLLFYFFNIYHYFNHHLCICHLYVFIYHQLLNCPLSELALKLPTFLAFRVKVNQRLIIQNSVLIFSIPT